MSKSALQEDLKTVIVMELCTPDLKEHLEFNTKEMGYKETREAIMAYVERKRKDPSTAMEIGNHEHDCEIAGDWWGGAHKDTNEADTGGDCHAHDKSHTVQVMV